MGYDARPSSVSLDTASCERATSPGAGPDQLACRNDVHWVNVVQASYREREDV